MDIPGFSRYDIDEHGTVTEKATGNIVEPREAKYLWVYIYPDNLSRKVQINVHVLQALANLGPCEPGYVVRYKDGNLRNLSADNLEYIERGKLAVMSQAKRRPKKNNSNTPESRQMVYDALCTFEEPVTMTELASVLQVPYSVVRFSMYHLLAEGKVDTAVGGYVAIC